MTTNFSTSNIIGYTGFSMLCGNSVSIFLHILQDKFNANIDTAKVNYSIITINILSGSLILTYGILDNNSVIYSTIPAMMLINVIILSIKIYDKLCNIERLY